MKKPFSNSKQKRSAKKLSSTNEFYAMESQRSHRHLRRSSLGFVKLRPRTFWQPRSNGWGVIFRTISTSRSMLSWRRLIKSKRTLIHRVQSSPAQQPSSLTSAACSSRKQQTTWQLRRSMRRTYRLVNCKKGWNTSRKEHRKTKRNFSSKRKHLTKRYLNWKHPGTKPSKTVS